MLIKWKITCLIFQIIFQVLFGHDLDMAALSSKESARTHDQARAVICCVCGKKVEDKSGGVRCVNERPSKLVCQYVYSSFSILNPVWELPCNTLLMGKGIKIQLLDLILK